MTTDPDFAARLERIRAAKGQAILMVGQDEQHLLPRREAPQLSRSRDVLQNAAYPASLLGAILLGMLGVFMGRYVHYQLLTSVTELQDPMSELIFGAVFGLAAAFVLSQAFKLTSKEHRSLQGMGVFVMACMFHNLAHWAPRPMSLAFSPDYVAEVVASTPPTSFRLGGSYYPLIEGQTDPAATSLALLAPDEKGATEQAATVDCPASVTKPKVWALTTDHKSGGPKTLRTASDAPQNCP